jgi:hypothetical protein
VPRGSVGIAGEQTGIYPAETPGGWQIIGRTPLRPFDLARPTPFLMKAGDEIGSTAVRSDAWHHRSDAITSAAAFIGISIALIGGPGYESADDWAAIAACFVIGFNAKT